MSTLGSIYNAERFIETLEKMILLLQQKINEATNGKRYNMSVLKDLDSKLQIMKRKAYLYYEYLKNNISLYKLLSVQLRHHVQKLVEMLLDSDSDTLFIFSPQIISLKAIVGTLE
ncbi:hypothetical protein [Fictibacillus sp. BK138]|uniref:hypothetical protein n=1 Tax=Fictibacillus sp. BK138 TaxID=2512121 RepID=UPI00102A8423|nr:hypothetical protein [Fictibacillus sp. BK138]RZT23134.1 hypothetical protein EV282_2220 [Fictibacillus sp. BK138]